VTRKLAIDNPSHLQLRPCCRTECWIIIVRIVRLPSNAY